MPDAWWAWAGLTVDDAVDDAGGLLGLLGAVVHAGRAGREGRAAVSARRTGLGCGSGSGSCREPVARERGRARPSQR